jgi:hypothetical protein
MMTFRSDIQALSQVPQGLGLAINLMLYLGECSFSRLDDLGPNYGWKPAEKVIPRKWDSVADILLVGLIKEAHREDQTFTPVSKVVRLKESIDYLANYKINTYFPRSYALMRSLV